MTPKWISDTLKLIRIDAMYYGEPIDVRLVRYSDGDMDLVSGDVQYDRHGSDTVMPDSTYEDMDDMAVRLYAEVAP